MTPLESELLQKHGIAYLYQVEELSVAFFFYGTSSLLMVYGTSTSSVKGAFVVLFSASVVIFMFVVSLLRVAYFLAGPDPPKLLRRRGFPNRATAAMFVVTVINFFLFSLSAGTVIATFITFFRKALTLDIEYPLSEKGELVTNTLQNLNMVQFWSAYLPVRSHLSLLDFASIHAPCRYYPAISLSFGGLGSSSKIDSG